MPIVVLVLVLGAYVYALVSFPEFRWWGLAGGALAALGLGVYFWQATPETGRTGLRISADEITLDQITVTPTVHGAVMTGRVLNGSTEWRLRDMTLTVRLRDCPTGPDVAEDEAEAAVADCPIIGEASAIARPDVPAGQIRAFSAHFLFTNLPEPAGELDWDWTITETRATR